MTYQIHQGEDINLKPVAKTGWPPPALLQDDDRKLFRWFANRLGSRRLAAEAAERIKQEKK